MSNNKHVVFAQKNSLFELSWPHETSMSLTESVEAVLALVRPPLPAPSVALSWNSSLPCDWQAAH